MTDTFQYWINEDKVKGHFLSPGRYWNFAKYTRTCKGPKVKYFEDYTGFWYMHFYSKKGNIRWSKSKSGYKPNKIYGHINDIQETTLKKSI